MLFNGFGKPDYTDTVSVDTTSSIIEAALISELTNEELSTFLENQDEVNAALEEGVLLEKTIVRLDKHAKLSRAYKAAIFKIAKEKNDPKFKKLLNIWKMERALEAYLEKKYGSLAMTAAKKTVRNAQSSKSKMVSVAANRVKQSLNSTPAAQPPKK